ncbi:FkbM family methyltransferase [Aliiroseovarius sp. S253]|uniref:FkbM family methyltransferase n=1 Tax=Aliiroseovarius sp. S253 TaxID=3415133 RepID=UPI003C7C21F4
MDSLDEKLDKLISITNAVANRMEDMLQLQRISLLEDGHVFNFLYNDEEVKMSLPHADRDFIQKAILRSGTFYETRQLELLYQKAGIENGSIIYDVGANIGNHSLFFALMFQPSRLVSVEPQKSANRTLQENIRLNDIQNSSVASCMLGSVEGAGSITAYAARNTGATAFKEDTDGKFDMRTLDSLIDEETGGAVDFIKIDVEGMHIEVLSGAKKTLTEARPKIWIELREFKSEFDAAAEFLADFGYRQSHKLGAHDFMFEPS